MLLTATFNNMRTLKFKAQPRNTFFDYCCVRGNQIVEHSSDDETVFGSSWKLAGAAEHLINGSEKRICRLSFEF